MRYLMATAGLMIVLLTISACSAGGSGQAGNQVSLTLTEFKFEPSEISVKRGQRVVINIANKGTTEHNFTVPDLNVVSKTVPAGQSGTVEFTPDKTGTFKFDCSMPGHEAAGMVGRINIAQ